MSYNFSKPFEYYLLQILLIMLGIGAVVGGAALILAPDGGLLKMPVSILEGSPFHNYLIPGVILLLFNGALPLITAYGLASRPQWKLMNALNIDRDYFWASTFGWNIGVILVIWLAVQFQVVGYGSIIQFIYLLLAAAIIGLSLLPRIRRMYRTAD